MMMLKDLLGMGANQQKDFVGHDRKVSNTCPFVLVFLSFASMS